MKSLLVRSLLAAVLIGPLVTFVSTVASMRTTVAYVPGISQDEFKSYDSRPVSELEAFMKSRQVKFTRTQWLHESIGYAYFWRGIAWQSLGPSVGMFLGCVIVGSLERRPIRAPDTITPG